MSGTREFGRQDGGWGWEVGGFDMNHGCFR